MVEMQETKQLLEAYVREGCEDAFRRLVEQHVHLVYSTALRTLNGDSHAAQDITQMVFSDLARKANSLPSGVALGGWLYRRAYLKALELVRAQNRRRTREQVAVQADVGNQSDAAISEGFLLRLDEGLQRLREKDRDALVLRFFESKDFRALGEALGISEDAAQKRVARALEKLRSMLTRETPGIPATQVAACLAVGRLEYIPGSLAQTACSAALHTQATTAPFPVTFFKTMASAKLKYTLVAGASAILVISTVLQQRTNHQLRDENLRLRSRISEVEDRLKGEKELADSRSVLMERAAEGNQELLRLRNQLAQLKREKERTADSTGRKAGDALPQADAGWIHSVLAASPAEQGSAAGSIRGKLLRADKASPPSATEVALQQALLEQDLNQRLESSPKDFADFQSAFIQAALGLTDAAQVEDIRKVIQNTYENAITSHLNIPSKPVGDANDWVLKRHQLDRAATAAVKQLLSQAEVRLFDRAFLGVMGVDLGGIGVDKSNYPSGFLADSP
jgi:RNA polymerase sigma factor (sigma-70 family)